MSYYPTCVYVYVCVTFEIYCCTSRVRSAFTVQMLDVIRTRKQTDAPPDVNRMIDEVCVLIASVCVCTLVYNCLCFC